MSTKIWEIHRRYCFTNNIGLCETDTSLRKHKNEMFCFVYVYQFENWHVKSKLTPEAIFASKSVNYFDEAYANCLQLKRFFFVQ